MAWWLSNPSAGLDIGSDSVKWCAVEPGKLRSYLLSGPLLDPRLSQRQRLEPKQREQRLAELVQHWRHISPVWPKKVSSCLQGEGVMCDYLEFPALSTGELTVALAAAIPKNVPFPAREQITSHLRVPPLNDPSCTGVFYNVILREKVTELQSLLSNLSLEPTLLEATPLALVRELSRNHKLTEQSFGALVHCGFRWTHVVIQRGGHPYYARDFALAGGDFTRAFQASGQLRWNEAEELKRGHDLSQKAPPPVESCLQRWCERVRLHVTNFCSKNHVHIEEVYLSGGCAAWTGLPARLEAYLQVPVVRDDWDRMRAPKDFSGDSIVYKSAMGLALGGA